MEQDKKPKYGNGSTIRETDKPLEEIIKINIRQTKPREFEREILNSPTIRDTIKKGDLLHLILSNINPQELKFCETQKEVDSTLPINANLQRMYILIGKIVEQIKR